MAKLLLCPLNAQIAAGFSPYSLPMSKLKASLAPTRFILFFCLLQALNCFGSSRLETQPENSADVFSQIFPNEFCEKGDQNFRIDASPIGWAGTNGSTSGAGIGADQNISFVQSMKQLQDAVRGSKLKLIFVQPGIYIGKLKPGSNTTIIGTGPNVDIIGGIIIRGAETSNIVIRNLSVTGLPCSDMDNCRTGDDAVYIGYGAHHIWLDHLDISDGQDGNLDITQGADFVTISWSKFHYTYAKAHSFASLIAGSDDEPASLNKLNITYLNNWWSHGIQARQPTGRYGQVHVFNSLHDTGGGEVYGVGFKLSLIVENSYFNEPGRSIFRSFGSNNSWVGTGNIGVGRNLNSTHGKTFHIPYKYHKAPAECVISMLTTNDCGAGNTCTLHQ